MVQSFRMNSFTQHQWQATKGNFDLQDDLGPDVGQSPLVQEFSCHGDKLCQVAGMASASSMDPKSKLLDHRPDFSGIVQTSLASATPHPST